MPTQSVDPRTGEAFGPLLEDTTVAELDRVVARYSTGIPRATSTGVFCEVQPTLPVSQRYLALGSEDRSLRRAPHRGMGRVFWGYVVSPRASIATTSAMLRVRVSARLTVVTFWIRT